MAYVLKFIAVLAAFVIAVSAVVWITAGAERAAAGRTSRELQAVDAMMVALIARESAFRGYAQSKRMSMLEPYDEAAANLADAADLAREHAKKDDAKLREIGEQERLAERWAGSANDSVIRIRNGRPLGDESELIRSNLKARFTNHNDALRRLILRDNESAHRSAVERAVLLVALLTALCAAVAALL